MSVGLGQPACGTINKQGTQLRLGGAFAMSTVIRQCRYGDVEQVATIEKVVFPVGAYSRLDFLTSLFRAGNGFLVACRGDRVVGYVIAMLEGGDGVIQSLGVLPEFRRKGIGGSLLSAALGHLSGRCARVYLLVEAGNEGAISLYRKMLFWETGKVIRHYYRDGGDAIEMVRERLEPTTGERTGTASQGAERRNGVLP